MPLLRWPAQGVWVDMPQASTGHCVCDTGWRGDDCGQLDLDPTPHVAYGFTSTSAVSSWGGGPPAWDPVTQKYHLFVSEIAGHW